MHVHAHEFLTSKMWLVYLSEFEDWYTTVPVHSWFYSNGWLRHKKFPVNALLGEICKNPCLSHKLEGNSWWMEKIRYMFDFYYFTSPICWWWLKLVSTNALGIQFTFSTKDVSDSWSSWSSKTCHCVLWRSGFCVFLSQNLLDLLNSIFLSAF